MYTQRKSYSNRFSRGGRSFGRGSGSRFGRSQRSNPYSSGRIDPTMYISKAQQEEGSSVYVTDLKFTDYALAQKLSNNIVYKEYVHPTRIQADIIPQILDGKDVLGVACTGSGKTAAYLIPLINKALKSPNEKCLIIAPTRELINQIKIEFAALSFGTNLRDVVIMGGASYYEQIKLIRNNPQFVIATPGRLIDLCDRNKLDLSTFSNVVLDEVDEMLDMGFVHDVKKIISKLKTPRQSLFFSATLSRKSEEIANSLLKDPYKVEIEKQMAVKNVDQDIVKVSNGKNKIDVLHELLVNQEFKRVLIFSKTKRGAEEVSIELKKRGLKTDSLHGNKSLGQRTKVLSMFKKYEIDILVATDVASRGIDVPDITHVINYDPPATAADYIHRVGRTGRMGKKGIALTFVR